MFHNWQGEAFNQVPHSQNQIHGDDVAQQFGFTGGLVPGVTVSAYLLHPAAETLGMAFLESGFAHVRVGSPLYDEETFRVEITEQSHESYSARLLRPDGTVSANAEVSLDVDAKPPVRRGDPEGDKEATLMPATRENMTALMEGGCQAFSYRWDSSHDMNTYLRNHSAMAKPYQDGYANPSFILGVSNWVLASNAYMNPWIHLETTSQHFAPVSDGSRVVGEMTITDLFEKKGHEFVDAEIGIYDYESSRCFARVNLRAIYKLRGL